jgi:hypothetical protein
MQFQAAPINRYIKTKNKKEKRKKKNKNNNDGRIAKPSSIIIDKIQSRTRAILPSEI